MPYIIFNKLQFLGIRDKKESLKKLEDRENARKVTLRSSKRLIFVLIGYLMERNSIKVAFLYKHARKNKSWIVKKNLSNDFFLSD
jgi:hypothetical protein